MEEVVCYPRKLTRNVAEGMVLAHYCSEVKNKLRFFLPNPLSINIVHVCPTTKGDLGCKHYYFVCSDFRSNLFRVSLYDTSNEDIGFLRGGVLSIFDYTVEITSQAELHDEDTDSASPRWISSSLTACRFKYSSGEPSMLTLPTSGTTVIPDGPRQFLARTELIKTVIETSAVIRVQQIPNLQHSHYFLDPVPHSFYLDFTFEDPLLETAFHFEHWRDDRPDDSSGDDSSLVSVQRLMDIAVDLDSDNDADSYPRPFPFQWTQEAVPGTILSRSVILSDAEAKAEEGGSNF